LIYRLETWAEYYRDCQELWKEHYEEIAVDKDRMPMMADVEYYEACDRVGYLQIMTARDDGKMAGYVITLVKGHPHYASVLCGFEDMYFLSKPYRGGWTGVRLITEALKRLKARGVRKVFFHTKAFKNLGPLFERLGFKKTDEIYARWL